MIPAHRYYYLDNFKLLLEGLRQRYADLLDDREHGFIAAFATLPLTSQALLVRMIMRKGVLFRASKLRYDEIPDLEQAMAPLVAAAWVDDAPVLSAAEAAHLLRKQELLQRFALPGKLAHAAKADMLDYVIARHPETRPWDAWRETVPGDECEAHDRVYRVAVAEVCLHLRLLFFGNYRQDLREFVLADLGVFKYEAVELGGQARAFNCRVHIDAFFQLYRCREALHQWREGPADAADLEGLRAAIPAEIADCEWLEDRRQRLCFEVARDYERCGETARAVEVYAQCRDPRAVLRLERIANRARGSRPRRTPTAIPMVDMIVPLSLSAQRVEYAVLAELTQQSGGAAPVHYVENCLVNSLFGLLCWRAIFAPVPGAFFHAFHHGPADLASVNFRVRRQHIFAQCLSELDRGTHRETILATYRDKLDIVSPFVFWGALAQELLVLALECIPASHLKVWFEWILQDVMQHRAGFPDLIQFFPRERRYALIEVKGPGDRLQDNQRRCLEHCLAHQVPVSVVRVHWGASNGFM